MGQPLAKFLFEQMFWQQEDSNVDWEIKLVKKMCLYKGNPYHFLLESSMHYGSRNYSTIIHTYVKKFLVLNTLKNVWLHQLKIVCSSFKITLQKIPIKIPLREYPKTRSLKKLALHNIHVT